MTFVEKEYNTNVSKAPMILSNGVDRQNIKVAIQLYNVVIVNNDFLDLYRKFKVIKKDLRIRIYNGLL